MRLYQRPNGYFYVEFSRGSARSLKTKNRQTAQRLYDAIEIKWQKHQVAKIENKNNVTLADFTDHYTGTRKGEFSHKTTEADRVALENLISVLGADFMISVITEDDINSFKKVFSVRVKPVSVNTYLRHIKAALGWAVDNGYLLQRPVIKFVKTKKALPKIIQADILAELVYHIFKTDIQMWRIVQFALWTGTRRSEILGLVWDNVWPQRCKVTGKGDKERTVTLLPQAIEAIGTTKVAYRRSGPVFYPFHGDTVTHKFHNYAADVGIDANFHMLRHTSATAMLKSGVSLPVIQDILGHADIATTQIYAKVYDDMQQREMQRLKF